jgi:DNA-binding transcriptional regulator/RsmH inhibitor MraZ
MSPYFPLTDDILNEAPFWGQYQLKLDDTGRLRLCQEIVVCLRERNIARLWRCPDPDGNRFVLCPMEYRLTFIHAAQQGLEEAPNAQDRIRLLCSGTDAAIDSQGRIKIQRVCLDRAQIEPPQQVTVLGVGYWYEVTAWILEKDRDVEA